MDGAALGDLAQPLLLLAVEGAAQDQLERDGRDLPLRRLTGEPRLQPVQGPLLAFGVQPNREGRSGAERGEPEVDRRRAGVRIAT
jgi:hypothetical protein